jgi:hypothetical protein
MRYNKSMSETTHADADAYRAAVVDAINHHTTLTALGWGDSAGRYVKVELPNGRELLSRLTSDEGEAWTGWDYTDDDGEMIASVELQVRPHGNTYGPAATPLEVAEAVALFWGEPLVR